MVVTGGRRAQGRASQQGKAGEEPGSAAKGENPAQHSDLRVADCLIPGQENSMHMTCSVPYLHVSSACRAAQVLCSNN